MTNDKDVTGVVYSIQKYSVHDGPGIRTIVFLKGCPLSCKWCSNPESQLPNPQIAYNPNKCLGTNECKRCLDVCPNNAIKTTGPDTDYKVTLDGCKNCLTCAEHCPSGALNIYGEVKTVAQVLDTVEQDAIFYARSGGGMTISGGEPLYQANFAIPLLREAKKRRIKTAIECCGYVADKALLEAAEYLNTLLFDVKSLNDEKLKEYAGVTGERIVENLQKVAAQFPKLSMILRTPIVPGFNDRDEDIIQILDFLDTLPNKERIVYELLPYHRLGQPKYTYIGREYPLPLDLQLDDETFKRLLTLVKSRNW